MTGVTVPKYAYMNAKEGLRQRERYSPSQKPVLSVEEANEQGVNSGITTARTLIRAYEHDQELSMDMAKRIKSYLARNQADGERSLVARRVWGGQRDQRFQQYLERRIGGNNG